MKNVIFLLLVVKLYVSCNTKEDKKTEDIQTDTVQPNFQMIDKGGIIMPDKRDEL